VTTPPAVRRCGARREVRSMSDTLTLTDEDIETTFTVGADTSHAARSQDDADGTDADGSDGDASDGDATDSSDGDATDADGTDADGTDADGTDADGTDS
jgi:hypothetical protein